MLELPTLELSGTPAEMGRAHGDALREDIQAFVDMRLSAMRVYLRERGQDDPGPLFEIAKQSLEIYRGWDPEGHAEHQGIAEGANLEPSTLFLVTHMTDMRDALLLSAPSGPPLSAKPEEGCTSVLVPKSHAKGERAIVAQSWDLNPPDVDYVIAIRRRPNSGPQTWSVTCVGCLSLVGINDTGLCIGTTNIKTYGSRPGVGYLGLLHRMLNASSLAEVREVVTQAPLAGAHTYWAADADEQVEWEASATHVSERSTDHGPIWRSNHCLVPEHIALQGELPSDSSEKRFARMGALVTESKPDLERMKAIYRDRSDGVHSINRYAEDAQGTATNSVFIASPAEKTAWACRGPADRGRFIPLTFD